MEITDFYTITDLFNQIFIRGQSPQGKLELYDPHSCKTAIVHHLKRISTLR
jgi:hypothetical protein